MAIKTSTFGGVTLTGEAAEVFITQFLTPAVKPNPLAQDALEKGRLLREEIQKKGYAIIHPKEEAH